MKNCKSLVAVALALAVCIGSFVGISPAEITASAAEAQASKNLIQNGGFEDEALGNWVIDATNTNCAAVSTVQANPGVGTHSLKMATVKAADADSTVKQTIAVKERTNYVLSYYVYSDGANWYNGNASKMTYSVMTTGNSPVTIGTGTFQATGTTKYKFVLVTLTFNSGYNTSLEIVFDLANNGPYNSGNGFSFFFIDDVSVTETGLITDGDFENISKVTESGNNNYAAFGAWETGFAYGANLNASEYRSGSQSLKLLHERSNSSNFYVYQQISVEKNTAYKLTFWYKSNETLACEVVTKHGFTYPYEKSDIILAHTVVGTFNDSAPEWREVTLNFNSGNNETLYVQFDANALGNTVKADTHYVYIDDVSVVGYIKGDVDMNGSIGATDLTTMRKILLGIEIDNSNAKVNNDEYIDVLDLVALKKLLCGLKAEN